MTAPADLNELTIENLTGRVAALERGLRATREKPESEAAWLGSPQLIRRALFEDGAALHAALLDAERHLRELRAQHRDLDRRWEAAARALGEGKYGDGVHPRPDAERLKSDQARIAAQLTRQWTEIQTAEEERDELAERLVRDFATVEVVPTRLPDQEDT
jgi:hypothetical protein